MRDVVICEPVRTPVGRYGGMFKSRSAVDLGVTVLAGLIARTKLPPTAIEDVIFAQCYPTTEAPALGRVLALDAGLPIDVPGLQIDRRCGSGLQAVIYAAMQVQTGAADLVIAGGAESMSNAAFFTHQARYGAGGDAMVLHDSLTRGRVTAGGKNWPVPGGMIETAENLREHYAIPREEQDRFALHSHAKAVAAQQAGLFAEEIIPVTLRDRKDHETLINTDEHPRPGLDMATLASLTPIHGRQDPAATVTAGNASGQNDGASACIVCTRAAADQYGLTPLAAFRSWAVAGCAPRTMGIGPVPSTAKALDRVGLSLSDIDLIELNEAFAAQVLACLREWKIAADDPRLNVHGSGISLGHPVGATGGRILATMLREMARREARYALETMCIGGGQGITAVFERVV